MVPAFRYVQSDAPRSNSSKIPMSAFTTRYVEMKIRTCMDSSSRSLMRYLTPFLPATAIPRRWSCDLLFHKECWSPGVAGKDVM